MTEVPTTGIASNFLGPYIDFFSFPGGLSNSISFFCTGFLFGLVEVGAEALEVPLVVKYRIRLLLFLLSSFFFVF